MPNFTLRKIEEVVGREAFFVLIKDGFCEVDEFENSLEDSVKDEINTIHFRMLMIARGEKLGFKQFRKLTSIHPKSFEVKSPNLRYYGVHAQKVGKVIVLCGFKSEQEDEFLKKNFAPRVREYLATLEEPKKTKKNKK